MPLKGQVLERVLVRGFVRDASSNEAMPSATILADGKAVTLTDIRGYFQFEVAHEKHVVRASYIGYESEEKIVEPEADESKINLFFILKQVPIQSDSVVVLGEEVTTQKFGASVVSLSIPDMASVPRFAEPDPVRIMQTLPGVTSADFDFLAQLNIRGGSFDETLISLDGVPVYNPYHFGGWFSMVNSDLLKREDLYRSNYPPNMSGYLSGVLNMVSKDGTGERHKGIASLGVSSASLVAEGPMVGGTYVVGARRIWLDLVFNLIKQNTLPYYFYDVFAKYSLPIDQNNLLKISVFYSRDVLDPIKSYSLQSFAVNDYPHWANRLIRGGWNLFARSGISLEFSLYESRSQVQGNVQADYGSEGKKHLLMNNGITERAAQFEATMLGESSQTVLGASIKELAVDYSWDVEWSKFGDPVGLFFPRPSTFFDYADNAFRSDGYEKIIGFYGSHRFKIDQSVGGTLGFRADYVNRLSSFIVSPFMNVKMELTQEIDLWGAYGRYYQPLFAFKEAKKEVVFSAPYAIRFLASRDEEVSRSDHFSVGIRFNEIPFQCVMEIEGYYKERRNLPSSYFDSTAHYVFEDGYATGLDILLKRIEEPVSGWVGYSFSRSVKHGAGYDYFSSVDRTHSLKIVVGQRIAEWLRIDLFWTFATGVPYTDVTGKYVGTSVNQMYDESVVAPEWRPIEGRKNSARTIPYHRMDVGLTGSFVWGGLLFKPYLQVFNPYNAANPYLFDFKPNSSNENQRGSFIMPTFGVTAEF
mgnify:CR=1 FL=1